MEQDNPKTDIILSMSHTPTEDYIQQIVQRLKSYEFRKRLYPETVKRIWFYETAPKSSITYICETHPAHIRARDGPLKEDGIGNKEYNEYHQDWEGYDYAYRVRSCYRIKKPIGLEEMRMKFGIGGAPRGMVYVPGRMMEDVKVEEQECIWKEE
ncbi:hypothetical protein L486_05835 [Kwoniella mangroviensis CBS 10435]|uniref:Uncharacterized protein n=1 Tax=Kwoniella mangroviensis CBS 10435 TaxID=1331196 RepID=A0A1B9IN26_9TREE|nr:uncharacterized protein I203_03110 [Kwoniella mangroviensis CBS 8507]OCF56979.1 hypothetical protein L486_05835 [Kwoniella mangroviensis CBS 10435]OCF67416.1 hypothetical protein I203_03110 [Kwoniella mangroviensis CBS 8507]OCF75551.1 hypothetical protein I204_04407 [Kwoniella mangroviensis CBS 8886]